MPATISSALLDSILADAAANPDREVCGLLLGGDTHILEVRAAANVAAEPETRFEIDPRVLIAAHRAARAGGHRLLGHYHSHPGGSLRPSACDAEMAEEPGQFWLICDGRGGHALWRSGTGGLHGRFEEDNLIVSPAPMPLA